MISSRELALKILYDIDTKQAYSNIQLSKSLNQHDLSSEEAALTTELVYGVVKWRLHLDWIIAQFSNIKLHKISPWIINILRLGVYQIKYLDKIPQFAAVNECVNLAKRYGNKGSIGFVNGLLRSYIKNIENIKYPDKSDITKYISVIYSHPEDLVEKWLSNFGQDFTISLCQANNQIAPLTIRVNTSKCSKEELKEIFTNENIDFEDGLYNKDALIISPNQGIANYQSFKDGLFQVQDESSMTVGNVLDAKPGESIVDVCSAPGGKSTHIAQIMNNKGKIYSRDIYLHKIKLIEDNANRLGINIIEASEFDATVVDEKLIDACDRVLVDAPCSGFGIIRRKPEIRWNKDINNKESLTNLQRRILEVSSKYVKTNGYLIYSTCTIEDDENIDLVKDFLKDNNNFELVDISDHFGQGLLKDTCKDGYIQLYPNIDKVDGFFIAKMQRKN